MRWLALLARIVGWLLTPLVVWAASFLGAWLATSFATGHLRRRAPDLYFTIGSGLHRGLVMTLIWMRILRSSRRLRHSLHVTARACPSSRRRWTPPRRNRRRSRRRRRRGAARMSCGCALAALQRRVYRIGRLPAAAHPPTHDSGRLPPLPLRPSRAPTPSRLTVAPRRRSLVYRRRVTHDSAGHTLHRDGCWKSAEAGRRTPVPLLYTGEPPRRVNDSTIEAADLAALSAGQPLSGQPRTPATHEGAMRSALLLRGTAAAPAAGSGPGIRAGPAVHRAGGHNLPARFHRADHRAVERWRFTGPTWMAMRHWGISGEVERTSRCSKAGSLGLYLVGGFVRRNGHSREARPFWGSWSGGVGYEVFPFGVIALGIEGRYRALGPGRLPRYRAGIPSRCAPPDSLRPDSPHDDRDGSLVPAYRQRHPHRPAERRGHRG